mmetsp:Transcript_25655/g.57673  ORF Transcript_25655/g.57673 Transcript_25655/m.57673 type:complete len:89 (+) Transcript_25655:191-457(+)|eukprot:171320-Hanusia_phi.AAC.1
MVPGVFLVFSSCVMLSDPCRVRLIPAQGGSWRLVSTGNEPGERLREGPRTVCVLLSITTHVAMCRRISLCEESTGRIAYFTQSSSPQY